MTAYNSEKEVGEVISYEFKGSDEDTFTRSSSLNITVSKGPQPAGVVVVSDFVGKHYSEVETWGKNNKITINKVTSFSEKVEKDYVISQSIEPKKEVKEGDILTVVVSEGKAVYAKNFVGMTSEELSRWASKNGVYLISEDVYSGAYDEGYVIYQSIPEGQLDGEVTSADFKGTFYVTFVQCGNYEKGINSSRTNFCWKNSIWDKMLN